MLGKRVLDLRCQSRPGNNAAWGGKVGVWDQPMRINDREYGIERLSSCQSVCNDDAHPVQTRLFDVAR